MSAHYLSLAERVALYTERRTAEDCWPWKGSTDQNGYAQLRWKGRLYRVSHFFCRLVKNQIAMHRCNNPVCVNPAHIKAGTRTSNNVDALRDGLRKGLTAPKLTWEQARCIRHSDKSVGVLAHEFKVKPSVIYSIKAGRTYVIPHSEKE